MIQRIPVYVVKLHDEIDLVTSSYDAAVRYVSDDSLDKFGQHTCYYNFMEQFGTTPDDYIKEYSVEVPRMEITL